MYEDQRLPLKSEQVLLKVTPAMRRRLQREAERLEVSAQTIIRWAIESYLGDGTAP